MAWKATYQVPFRRRREEKTNYKKRLALLKSGKARLVVRRTNKRVLAQIIQFLKEGDKILVDADSRELKKFGWKAAVSNLPAAYLTGFLCGLKAKQAGLVEAMLDMGMATPIKGSIPFAVLKGALDANLNIAHDPKAFPSEERVSGKHIADFAASLAAEKAEKTFALYFKQGLNPANLMEHFNKTKAELQKGLTEKVRA